MKRVGTEQILEIKERNLQAHGLLSYDLKSLQHKWTENKNYAGRTTDFYIIRCVTIIEVFARRNIASLIDQAEQYTLRAVELSKHFKMEFDLVRNIQGRAITLGDIVAHSVPINSFGQIISYFEILLGKQLRPLLSQAIDRWAVEIESKPQEPIIKDFENLAAQLTRLFELRHILCHELPRNSVYAEKEVDELLNQAIQFAKALEEVLHFEKFGITPLTQMGMNQAAYDRLHKIEDEMSTSLSKFRSYVTERDNNGPPPPDGWKGTRLSCLNEAQKEWLLYRNAQCELDTYEYRGGTIRGMIWSMQAEELTKNRIKELQSSQEKMSQT